MKHYLTVALSVLLLVSGVAYAQVGGGISTPNFLKRSGNAVTFINSSWEFGSSASRLAKGWFTALDTSVLTIGSFASGDLTTSGDLFVNGGDIRLGTGSATTTLTVSSTAFAIAANATTTLGTTGLDIGSGQFVVQQTSGNVGIGTTSPRSLLHVAGGVSATTTIEYGDQFASGSIVCHNTKNIAGGAISFYFVGTTLTVENNRCR